MAANLSAARVPDHYDAAAVRRDFPILATAVRGHPLVFLDSAASAQRPPRARNPRAITIAELFTEPAETVADVEKEGAAPRVTAELALPPTLMIWGESEASSEMVMVSVRWPAAQWHSRSGGGAVPRCSPAMATWSL